MDKYLCNRSARLIGAKEWDKLRKSEGYPNLLILKKWISKLEYSVVKNFAKANILSAKQKKRLEIDLEWFFTWRLKLAQFSHLVWCDGVIIHRLKYLNRGKYEMVGEIWLGPESDVNIEFLCPIEGSFILVKNRKEFDSYKFKIEYESQKYIVCK